MKPQNKIKILLVDDRPENLLSLAAVLENPEYDLIQARSGAEALRLLLHDEFALILLDVQMPEMDGFETASLVKQREISRDIPIIFVTALSRDEPFVYRGYETGAVDYILKPFNPDILRSKVAVFAELNRKNTKIREQAEALQLTEKLRHERLLARLEIESLKREQVATEKYQDLVEGIHHGLVWTANPVTLQFTFPRPAQLKSVIGFSEKDWETNSNFWFDHIHPDDQERVQAEFKKGVELQTDFAVQHRFMNANGSTTWFHTGVKINKRKPGDGKYEGELRGLSIDVTHLKEAEETACKAIRVRDEFLSIASHELKTPLTPLKLQLQMLKRLIKITPPERMQEKLEQMIDMSDKQIERLTRLVEELLDVARINNGKMILEYEKINLADLVREILDRYSEDLVRAGCKVTADLENEVYGEWDRLRIEQVFINLLTNAKKYGAGKPIRISVSSDGQDATLRVRDEGIGIKDQDQERIFSRFERASASSYYGGLGLGLYIVRQILDAHGGKITVESAPERGSTFIARFPLRPGTNLKTVHLQPVLSSLRAAK